ncbi:MAG: ubiquinone/menaquinone biosynthesis C-methylase UbiE [Paracoccaceae bacterium]|jgi:ubiquinone/menaquinone biosynthesis C-methylase UbiE
MANSTEPDADELAAYYSSGSLLQRITAGLATLGQTPPLSLETLAPLDEFHIGGRQATVPFLQKLGVGPGDKVLDLGCGLGGPARFAAHSTGAQVTGIDLTEEFVTTGQALTDMAGLTGQVGLVQGSILDLPFPPGGFDAAYMIHVGMNIADKAGIATQVARALKPGGVFGIYDVMRVSEGDLRFPVPWASGPSHSALATPATYRAALEQAGFVLESQTDLTGFAREFFARMAAAPRREGGPPPLGLHLVMDVDGVAKMGNLARNIADGTVAPIEMIARRAA